MTRLLGPPTARHGSPDWQKCAQKWPHSEHSQFWTSGDIVWHIQRFGAGPALLLIHGAGGASHSWRNLANALMSDFEIIIVDLPGHGFTQSPPTFKPSLGNVSLALGTLLSDLDIEPDVVAGHSAGAAIAIKMTDLEVIEPKMMVSINGALQPFDGAMRVIAPLTAKLAAASSATAWLISKRALKAERVQRLIKDIGSDPAKTETALYEMLFRYPGHVRGTLDLMANWNLVGLIEASARLNTPTLYLSADQDKAVPPSDSAKAATRSDWAVHQTLENVGHLAHEEDADRVAQALRDHWAHCANQKTAGRPGQTT